MTLTRSRVASVVVPSSDAPRLSVVLVTYGTGSIVVESIAAIVATLGHESFEVIVVDNPADGGMPTADRLRLQTSGVYVVRPERNLGFGGGNQLGAEVARGELLCLTNPDVVALPGWWEPLADALDDPTVAIAAPVLLNPDGSIQECGQSLDHRAVTAPVTSVPDRSIVDVTYSSAACWLLRRSEFRDLGGFDDRYFPAYFEDVDYALRVQQSGMRTVVATTSRVVHHSGTSTRRRPEPATRQQAIFKRRWADHLAGLRT